MIRPAHEPGRRLPGLVVMVLLAIGGCSERPSDGWEQHAYVWSRSSYPAQLDIPDEVGVLRVLVAQWPTNSTENWMLESRLPDAATRSRPIVAVVRLDGSSITVPAAAVADQLRPNLQRWLAGRELLAVEVDHDSATSRLDDYARWLRAFRTAWDNASPVWITALPDWRRSASLSALLDASDVYTLQVHAIDADAKGLIDVARTKDWMTRFEALSDTPYFLALPTYALRVGWGEDGSVRFVEAESRIGAAAAKERTFFADPVDLASLAASLREHRSSKLRGIAWFRLPDPHQRNAISPKTFRPLVAGTTPERNVMVSAIPVRDGSDTFDLVLQNAGKHDAGLPLRVRFGAGCEAGDVASSYRVAPNRIGFDRTSEALLRSGQSRSLGWIRCASSEPPSPTLQW